jgi:metal-responsive CopG/Arc/MetJ family transcriptional regulator
MKNIPGSEVVVANMHSLVYTIGEYLNHLWEGAMQHLSITFPEALREELDLEAKREKTKRSTLIQKAVRLYLKLKRRSALQDLLKEGYLEMAGESERLMNEFRDLDTESSRYVD